LIDDKELIPQFVTLIIFVSFFHKPTLNSMLIVLVYFLSLLPVPPETTDNTGKIIMEIINLQSNDG
jgi:uncharacterized protein (DUF2141 family)